MRGNLGLCLLICGLLGSTWQSHAMGQTCAAPATWIIDAAGNPPLNDTTCNHETGIVAVCGIFGAPGQAYVLQINVTAAATFTDITFAGGPGYTLASYLVPVANGCNTSGACTTTGDASTHMRHVDMPPGAYFLIVTGADFDPANACGPFTMSVNGFVPVTLQQFSID